MYAFRGRMRPDVNVLESCKDIMFKAELSLFLKDHRYFLPLLLILGGRGIPSELRVCFSLYT